MKLLDAVLAFSLTLAALASVVTVIMEAGMRAARMRRRNLLATLSLLNGELGKGPLGMDPEQRKRFLIETIRNPSDAAAGRLAEQLKRYPTPEAALASLGFGKVAGVGPLSRLLTRILQTIGISEMRAVYTKVSLEHVVRRLAEAPPVQARSLAMADQVKVELNRLARKYEEFSSATSATFKRSAQAWSIGVGIVVALVANLDGLRIFEAYRADAELAQTVIAQQQALIDVEETARQRRSDIDEAEEALDEAENALEALALASPADGSDAAQLEQAEARVDAAQQTYDALVGVDAVRATADRARDQLGALAATGIPIGWQYYPACPYGQDDGVWQGSDRYCRAVRECARRGSCADPQGDAEAKRPESPFEAVRLTIQRDALGFARWFIAVLLTGVLIGLGAPFWLDVAKRLAQLRGGLQRATATGEARMSGANANGNPRTRRRIVNQAVDDVVAEAGVIAASGPGQVPGGTSARQVADDVADD